MVSWTPAAASHRRLLYVHSLVMWLFVTQSCPVMERHTLLLFWAAGLFSRLSPPGLAVRGMARCLGRQASPRHISWMWNRAPRRAPVYGAGWGSSTCSAGLGEHPPYVTRIYNNVTRQVSLHYKRISRLSWIPVNVLFWVDKSRQAAVVTSNRSSYSGAVTVKQQYSDSQSAK